MMYKSLFTSLLICYTLSAGAQTLQGTVVYEQKINMRRGAPDDMKAVLPEFRTVRMELLYCDSLSLYRSMPSEDRPDPFDGQGGGGMTIRIMGGENDVIFRNTSSSQEVEKTALEDQDYLVTDSIREPDWKLSDETKVIAGDTCRKATMKSPRGMDIVAWYTEKIPLPLGPAHFGGLPGLILQMDIDNGGTVFTLVNKIVGTDLKAIQAPSKGQSITRADFQAKMKALFGSPDKNGHFIRAN